MFAGISLKQGVQIAGCSQEILFAAAVAAPIWAQYGAKIDNDSLTPLVITSGRDGYHSSKSKHYRGDALDFRVRNMPRANWEDATKLLANCLGRDYDVILEDTNLSNAHVHVEFEPRRPR